MYIVAFFYCKYVDAFYFGHIKSLTYSKRKSTKVISIEKVKVLLPFSIARTLMPFLLAYSKRKDTKVLPIEKVKILMPTSIASTLIPFLVGI